MLLSLVAASTVVLGALELPIYVEGVLTIPGTYPMAPEEVKCKAWVGSRVIKAEIGDRLTLFAISTGQGTMLQVADWRSSESVTLQANPQDHKSEQRLFELESSIFPLLPERFGPAPTSNAFFDTIANMEAHNAAYHVSIQEHRDKIGSSGTASYDTAVPLQGRVSWDYHLDVLADSMFAWHFTDPNGRIRSMAIGRGALDNGFERTVYDSDSPPPLIVEPLRARFNTKATLQNGSLTEIDGPLEKAIDISQWLERRAAYTIK